ncbi:MAG: OB-fold nucleic acid binding domain-containing protein [Thermoleophilia bacterium]|nr:OB-fold nucleic acid binding domain-containing protein [Thermoleophilia bacterium]
MVEGRIRFGLNAVKNVGETAIRTIIAMRETAGPFQDLFDFCERVDLGIVNRRALESLIKAGALDSTEAPRRGMLVVLAQAMAHGQKTQADAAQGQGSIFDLMEVAPASGASRNGGGASRPVDIPAGDFDKAELLRLEKETLGLYVSSHPLRDIRRQVRDEAEHLISQLPTLNDGTVTTIVGMVGGVKKVPTKSGDTMAFVTVDGLEGSVEVICFPKLYQSSREFLEEDALVKIRGKVERKDESELKFIPYEFERFVPRTGEEPVCIVLDAGNLPRSILDDIKGVLTHFPGPCPVEMHISTPEGRYRLRCGEQYRVDPQTSLFAELKVLLGESCVTRYEAAGVG